MYESLALVALFVFIYSVVAGRVERSIVSGPIVFVLFGFLIGPLALGWYAAEVSHRDLRILADLTLALVLFIDAANANLSIVKLQIKMPSRMLLVGLPGVIGLGFVAALYMFDSIGIFEAAILATMLAATDAALGKAVITATNPRHGLTGQEYTRKSAATGRLSFPIPGDLTEAPGICCSLTVGSSSVRRQQIPKKTLSHRVTTRCNFTG